MLVLCTNQAVQQSSAVLKTTNQSMADNKTGIPVSKY